MSEHSTAPSDPHGDTCADSEEPRPVVEVTIAAPVDADPVSLPSHGEGGLRPGVDLDDKQAMAERVGDDAPG